MRRIPLTISFTLLLCCYANAQSRVDPGTVHDGMYINPGFGFSYKYPKDWVVHGEATKQHITELGKEKMAESGAIPKASADVSLKRTYNLLTVFRYAVGTPDIGFNPAVLVLAERVDHAPGIVTGKEYLLNVRTLVRKSGAQILLQEPSEYHFAKSQFFRDDYVLTSNGIAGVQSMFCTVANGYALVFIFIGNDQTAVDEMAKTMETFAVVPPVRRGITTIINTPPPPKPKKHPSP